MISARKARQLAAGLLAWALAGPALAQSPPVTTAPTCGSLQAPGRDRLAVVWVSPTSRRVGSAALLQVFPAVELRHWADDEGADLARTLRYLGLRRSEKPPRRPWKATVFDIDVAALCRPIALLEAGAEVAGIPVCDTGARQIPGSYQGTGCTLDLFDATPGSAVYAVRWRDAALSGFCVLPLERFLSGP